MIINITKQLLYTLSAKASLYTLVFLLILHTAAIPAAAQTISQLVEQPLLIKVQTDDSWNYEAEFFLTTIYGAIENDQYATANEFVDKLLAQKSDNVQVLQLASHIKMHQKIWGDARTVLSRLVILAPDNQPAMVRLGYVNSRLGLWQAAANNFETVLERNPSPELKAYAETALAEASKKFANDTRQAQQAWETLEHEAALLEAGSHWPELEQMVGEYLPLRPDDMRAVMLRARAQLAQDKFNAAANNFTFVLESSSSVLLHEQALTGLTEAWKGALAKDWNAARDLETLADFAALKNLLSQMHAKQPNNPYILIKRAETWLKLGPENGGNAMDDLQSARALPYLLPTYNALINELWPKAETAVAQWRKSQAETLAQAEERAAERAQAEVEMVANIAEEVQAQALAETLERAKSQETQMYERALKPGPPDWPAINVTVDILTQRQDWPALQQFFSDYIKAHPQESFGYYSRGYMLQNQGRYGEAGRDFIKALDFEQDEAMRESLKTVLADTSGRLEEERRRIQALALLKEVDERAAGLIENEDWRGLEQMYGKYIDQYPQNVWLRANRGFVRLDLGLVGEGRQDLNMALKLKPDYELKSRITATLQDMATREAKGETIGSFRADGLIWRAAELVAAERYDEASVLLLKLDNLMLSKPQKGLQSYLNSQILWHDEQYETAFGLFKQAINDLTFDFYQAEAYSRMAEYSQKQGDLATAEVYIAEAVKRDPENVWRNIQAGGIYSQSGSRKKALDYYEAALARNELNQNDIYFYAQMAQAYRELDNWERFDYYTRCHIDSEQARINALDKPSNEDLERLYQLKRDFSNATDCPYGGSIYAFHNQYHDNDHINSISLELKRSQTLYNYRTELYGKVGTSVSSSFSGSYFNPWSGSNETWRGKSYTKDNMHAAVGARIYPFASYGLNLGLEHRFKIGDATKDDTLTYINIYEAVGNEWEPLKEHWPYASLYSQLNYSLQHDELTYGGEVRGGYSFYMPLSQRLIVLTPFWGISSSYGGRFMEKGRQWGLDHGPGLLISKWFDEDDPYKIPTESIQFAVQYKFGLSHGIKDYLMFSVYYAF